MPNLNDILHEASAVGSGLDLVRRKYIQEFAEYTGRNVIVYYSGWLQKPIPQLQAVLAVNDNDKNGFMATIHQLNRTKGLDLVLHTPGGDTAATESIVEYLRQMFGSDIRAFIPQLAMSAGTMMALACKEIFMGKHSNLGPIDPQVGAFPAHGVIEEFKRAAHEIQTANDAKEQQAKIAIWQPIIAKYNPTLIGLCQQAITWSNEIVTKWLTTGMFASESDARAKASRIVGELGSHILTKTHARHIHLDRLRELGIKVAALEDDQKLQDAVLAVHHSCIHTLTHTAAVKIIENQNKISFILAAQLAGAASGSQQQLPPQP